VETATQPFTGTFELDSDHSSVQFAVRHMKVSIFRASFADIDGRLVADGLEIRLEGNARADSVSITSPPEFREHVVRSADFFHAGEYPELSFRSSEVDLREDGRATVTGELTVRGISRSVTATGSYRPPVEDPYGSFRAALELRAAVDRRAWEMDWQMPLPDGSDVLGWEVEITAHLELIRAD
jgi:polyisoprenoid-binding protein YceI